MAKEKNEKWIQAALGPKSKGKLHKKLGIPEGKKIPISKLKSAEKKGGKIAKEAQLAETLKKMKK